MRVRRLDTGTGKREEFIGICIVEFLVLKWLNFKILLLL